MQILNLLHPEYTSSYNEHKIKNLDGRKSDVENNTVNNTFKLRRPGEGYTKSILSYKIGEWTTDASGKFLEMHFVKLILSILISLSNFLFYLCLPITMKKYTLREIWLWYKWLMMKPKGTYKEDLVFQCIFVGNWTKSFENAEWATNSNYESWRECHQPRNYGFQCLAFGANTDF